MRPLWNIRLLPSIFITLLLTSCGNSGSDVLISIQTGIPVHSRTPTNWMSHFQSRNLANLMSVTPGVDCYQKDLSVSVEDAANGQILTSMPVPLRTNLATFSSSVYNSNAGVDTVVNHLINQSFLEAPLEMLVPSTQSARILFSGVFHEPVDVDLDGNCDPFNLSLSSISNTIQMESSLPGNRFGHTSTLMPNGNILVIGGDDSYTKYGSVFMFDIINRVWISKAPLITARARHTATLLPNGKVLVVGGYGNSTSALSSAELYDPSLDQWTPAGSMTNGRGNHTATLMNGKVLVIGGTPILGATPNNSFDEYTISTGFWSASGSLPFGLWNHTATLLRNGVLVIIGGSNNNTLNSASPVVYLYDPTTTTWTSTTSTARTLHTANVIPGTNSILVVGGMNTSGDSISNVDLYSYSTSGGIWVSKSGILTARYSHTTEITRNNVVVVSGGEYKSGSTVNTINQINITRMENTTWNWNYANQSSFTTKRNFTSTLLPDGRMINIGGYTDSPATAIGETEINEISHDASFHTTLVGRAPVTSTVLQDRSIQLNIQLLNTNPVVNYSSLMTSNPGKFQNWIELPYNIFGTLSGGTAKLISARFLFSNQNSERIQIPLRNSTTSIYLPKIFPLELEFSYFIGTSYQGHYRTLITGPDPAGISLNAYYIPGTGNPSSAPPMISPYLSGPFPIKVY